jgi:hypothetical protein
MGIDEGLQVESEQFAALVPSGDLSEGLAAVDRAPATGLCRPLTPGTDLRCWFSFLQIKRRLWSQAASADRPPSSR